MTESSRKLAFITADWRHIAVLNYEVEPALLKPYLLSGLELSKFNNQVFLSLVGFQFQHTRMGAFSVPFYGKFIELYLGFFAQRKMEGQWRRGWIFIRKIVPNYVVAAVGRLVYNEDYITRPMREVIQVDPSHRDIPTVVRYEWKNRGHWNFLEVRTGGSSPVPVRTGSIEEYVTQNYGGFSPKGKKGGIEFPVEHPSWEIWPAQSARLDCDIANIYGHQFVEYMQGTPHSAFLANGSRITLGKAWPF